MSRFLLFAVLAAVPIAAASYAQEDDSLSRWKANTARHQHVLMQGVPAPYDKMLDPTPDNEAKLRRGTMLFERNCSSCHGWSGRGTGPEGSLLVPAPADLQWLAHAPKERAGPYIYWSIAEGGKRFDSEMPGYKQSMTQEDIWALTAYLRAGMPYASP
ncbi:cytochrome c [Sphingomonas sp. HDW15A]|uniref:c-type cytochrome n=1 Tax=Sphingomonas sp. HDW15A TaxID=2714942 RepID=UPI00140D4F20|nr:cytochrome c [Sphingomonas sp. HDW15A]QIK96916.1 cytochrome c [Sphingomonas sp. HDW15A]